jgi:O-antigen/teichoic acid export membrane protein
MSGDPATEGGVPEREVSRRIARGTSTFLGASFARQGLMVALLPALTTQVSPEQYGRVAVASTIAAVAVILIGLGLETAVFRVWFDTADDMRRRATFLRAARSLLAASSFITVTLVVVTVMVIDVPSDAWSPWLITLSVVGAVGQSLINSYALPLFRAQERLRDYLRLQMTVAIVQVVLLVLLVLIISLDARGWILATAIAQWAGVAVASRTLRTALDLGVEPAAGRELLGFGLPLIPHAVAHWSLAGMDRLILLAFVPATTVGIYGLVYTVSAVVGTALTEVNRALMNEYGRILQRKDTSLAAAGDELNALASIQVIAALVVTSPRRTKLALPSYRLRKRRSEPRSPNLNSSTS